MTNDNWFQPIDQRIQQIKQETEQIKNENAAIFALLNLYSTNNAGLKRLAKE